MIIHSIYWIPRLKYLLFLLDEHVRNEYENVSNYSLAIVPLVLWLCFWCCDTCFDILIAFLWLFWTRIFPRCIILDTCINKDGAKQVLTPIFFFPYLRLFPNNSKIFKQSLHSLGCVFCSDKFGEEKMVLRALSTVF